MGDNQGRYNGVIHALILAGGKSSRMGQDKALLPWRGHTILQHICQVARACTQKVYLITPWPERYDHLVNEPDQFIQELEPDQGPLIALIQGLAVIKADWILLLACDLPLLEIALLQNWIEQLDQLSPDILAVIPYHNSRWEPLCGFYRHQALISLQNFRDQGKNSLQNWLNQVPVKALLVDEIGAKMLLNCNTPRDYAGLIPPF